MKRLLVLLGLLFCSVAAFAAGPAAAHAASGPSATDVSITYLGQLFGTVPGALHGSSGGMMGRLFMIFNAGLMAVASLWIAYTAVTFLVRMMTEGHMGQQSRVYLTFFRMIVGLALLAPVMTAGGNGYDGMQSLVMQVVVKGVDLADTVWSWGLKYMAAGGSLYVFPQSGQVSNNAGTTAGSAFAMAALQAQTCMDMSTIANQANAATKSDAAYKSLSDSASKRIYFPGYGNVADWNTTTGTKSACGSLSWAMSGQGYCSSSTAANGNGPTLCQAQQSAAESVVTDIQPAAQVIACATTGSTSSKCCTKYGPNRKCEKGTVIDSTTASSLAQAISNATIDYQNLMQPVEHYAEFANQSGFKKHLRDFIPDAMSQGWIMAGRFFWDASMLNDHTQGAGSGATKITLANNVGPRDQAISQLKTMSWNDLSFDSKTVSKTKIPSAYMPVVQQNLTQHYQQNAASTGADRGGHSGGLHGLLAALLGIMTGGISTLFNTFVDFANTMNHVAMNPMIFLHKVGMMCLNMVGALWLGVGASLVLIYSASFVCAADNPLGYAIRGGVSWIQPLITAVIGMLAMAGVMLGYYVPLYPYILFTFAVVSWFLLVFETVVAAPMVAVGLTHPEGHDFLGKAEQALMLLLNVFLRPSLMIIGLFAGMILSYIALSFVNVGFGAISSDLFSTSALMNGGTASGSMYSAADQNNASSSSALGVTSAGTGMRRALDGGLDSTTSFGMIVVLFLVPPLMLIIFSMIVKSVVNQSYSLISYLPNNIMRWIGSPTQPDQSEQHARELRGGQQAAQVGGALNQGGANAGQAIGGFAQEQRGKQDADAELGKGLSGQTIDATGGSQNQQGYGQH